MRNLTRTAGFLAMATYCSSTAFAALWVTVSFTAISGAALTFFAFAAAVALFLALRLNRLRLLAELVAAHPGDVLLLNVTTLFSWWFMFMALQRIEASVEAAVYMGWIPIAVLAADILSGKARAFSLRALGPLLIAACMAVLVATRYVEGGAVATTPRTLTEGIVLGAVAGATGGLYIWLSGRFHRRTGCSALDLLCVRFFLLVLVTGWLGRHQIAHALAFDRQLVAQLMVLSLFSVMIPAFTLQYAIRTLGSSRVSVIAPVVPALALAAEVVVHGWPSAWVPASIVLVCGAIVLSNLWMREGPAIPAGPVGGATARPR